MLNSKQVKYNHKLIGNLGTNSFSMHVYNRSLEYHNCFMPLCLIFSSRYLYYLQTTDLKIF